MAERLTELGTDDLENLLIYPCGELVFSLRLDFSSKEQGLTRGAGVVSGRTGIYCAKAGWSYTNIRVFENHLRPFGAS